MNDDGIRKNILKFFFEHNEKRPYQLLPALFVGTQLRIPREKAVAAVQFLYDEGYLKREKDKFGAKYRISSKGVNHFGQSELSIKHPYSPMVINQTGGISIIGNEGSIGTVNQNTLQSFQEISKVVELISKSSLLDTEKLQMIGETESIRAELTKPNPDKGNLKRAWTILNKVATTINSSSEIIEALSNIAKLAAPFLLNS